MKGFTKDYWGLRGSIAALIKLVQPIEVTNLNTFMASKTDIKKTIRTKLPFENGGLFRTEEISALGAKYSKVSELLNAFTAKLEHPTEEFAQNFGSEYNPVKTAMDQVDKDLKMLAINRSKVLFPAGKKKSLAKFKAKTLDEKLEEVVEKHENLFVPESLPGISRDGTSTGDVGSPQWKKASYSCYSNTYAKEIIDSWYLSHSTEVESED